MSGQKSRESYLRVTQILSPFSGLQYVDPTVLQSACDRGTRVHKICEGIVLGLGEVDVDDSVWGYVESFKQWWSLGHEVVLTEHRFWDDDLEITGQIDYMIKTSDGHSIIDIKTSSAPSKTWRGQASAYAHLAGLEGYKIHNTQFLHLSKHGKPPKIHVYEPSDNLFTSIYHVYKHFYQRKEKTCPTP